MIGVLIKLTPFIFITLSWLALYLGGGHAFFPLIFNLFVHPLFDSVIKNRIQKEKYLIPSFLDNTLLFFFPILFSLFIFHMISLYSIQENIFYKINMVFAVGIISGSLGLIVAHEFIHSKEWYKRGIGIYILNLMSFSWFRVEHVYIHHKYLGSDKDPSSAKLDQSIYHFIPSSILRGIKATYLLEYKRVAKRYYKNRMLLSIIYTVVSCGIIKVIFGSSAVLFFISYSAVAIIFVSCVSYIQHYGLRRKILKSGVLEPISDHHSWDAPFFLTGIFTFNLNFHSHHHKNPTLAHYHLALRSRAPKFPLGHSTALLYLFVPLLWQKRVRPRVDEYLKRFYATI